MLTRKAAYNLIEEFIRKLVKTGIPIEKAILFGSYSKGGVHENSDIDLAIWSPRFQGWVGVDMALFAPIMGDFYPISVKTFNSSETAEDDPFIEEIEKTGKVIDVKFIQQFTVFN